MQVLPLPVGVEAAPELVGVVVRFVHALGKVELLVIPLRLVRLDTRAAHGAVEQAAHGEGVVPHELGIQPRHGLAPVQAVVRVLGEKLVGGLARTPIGIREQHRLDDVAHVPAALHELDGQPVQQLLVRRRLALRAEVVQNLRQARAEEHLPQAVDEHAGGERIVRIRHPASQVQAAQPPAVGGQRAHELRHLRLDRLAGIVHPVPTRKDPHRARLVDGLGHKRLAGAIQQHLLATLQGADLPPVRPKRAEAVVGLQQGRPLRVAELPVGQHGRAQGPGRGLFGKRRVRPQQAEPRRQAQPALLVSDQRDLQALAGPRPQRRFEREQGAPGRVVLPLAAPAGVIVVVQRVAQHRARLFAIRDQAGERDPHGPALAAEQPDFELAQVEGAVVAGWVQFQRDRGQRPRREGNFGAVDGLAGLLVAGERDAHDPVGLFF